MILEGILTTTGDDGSTNIAPMGPIVDAAMRHFVLRPFQSSTSFANLMATRRGVFHVTDDVELIARAAIGRLDELPPLSDCPSVRCARLADCCRWYAFLIESVDVREPRAEMHARVVDHGNVRSFFGFNRAKHAVLEAAILATRIHLLPPEQIAGEFLRLERIVEKTAGDQERRAFALLDTYVCTRQRQPVGKACGSCQTPS